MTRHTACLIARACLALAAAAAPAQAQAQDAASPLGMEASAQSVYTPPACVPGVPFSDITCSTGFDAWIEQFGLDGITAGCGGGKYCPGSTVTRDQMAVFIEKAMRGTGNWPPHTVLVFHRPAAEAGSNVSSGTELLAMVAAIPSSGSEAPSAANPWLVRLGPGIFDLGSSALTLPVYTALEGTGRDITVLTATGNVPDGTLNVGDHGTLSRLTVNNTGNGAHNCAVHLPPQSTSVFLEHVTVNATSPSSAASSIGIVTDNNTSFRLVDCEVNAHGNYSNYGIDAGSSSDETRLDNVRVTVYGSNPIGISIGLLGTGCSPVINNSLFTAQDGATNDAIYVYGGGGALDLRNSEIYTYGPGAGILVQGLFAILVGDVIDTTGYPLQIQNGAGATVEITGCNITAETTNWLDNVSGTVTVGASKLVGTTTGAGTTHCFGNYTSSAFLANTCP